MRYLFLFLATILVINGFGQVKKHVNWTYESKKITETEFQIIFKAKPEKDWHFYTINDKLNPLLFSFKRTNNYSLKGKIKEVTNPKTEYDELMEAERSFHEKEATFIFVVLSCIVLQQCLL